MLISEKYIRKNSKAFCLTALIFIVVACNQSFPDKNKKTTLAASSAHGKALAATWCASCHQFPEPSLLTREIWQTKALPYMGLRLGFHSPAADSFMIDKQHADTTIYPNHKLMSDDDWKDIIHYYTSLAPNFMLPQPTHEPAQESSSIFKTDFIKVPNEKPAVCFVKIDTLPQPHQIVFADAFKKIFRLNNQYQVLDFLNVPGPIVDMNFNGSANIYTNIGSIDPALQKVGSVGNIGTNSIGKTSFNTIFDTLARPVQTLPCDLNKDGKTDYIICEFGVDKGAVLWMENTGNDNYTQHILINKPGAEKAMVTDANQDGLPDVYVLMAQGDESIYLLTNKGNGNFDSKQLLRFPPVYGSVSFELDDFNKDGNADILYTCGDNADVTQVLKPYHGVYIFMNDGSNHFTQTYFYPMYGCYKAMAADFNNDGKLDIAAIAFFADYTNHPQDGFVYLQNDGNNHFKPYNIPETIKGRWLCMDVADIDGDKKSDIVLGNMAAPIRGEENNNRWAQSAPLLVLKNLMQ